MPRQKYEFYCTECRKYFDFTLNTSLNGNFRIHCPNCEHIHYRKLVNGAITELRFSEDREDHILIEDIIATKASCRDYQKETEKDLSLKDTGFMHRLWGELFGARA